MAGKDQDRRRGEGSRSGAPKGQAPGVRRRAPRSSRRPPESELKLPVQSPLFHAKHAGRYDRQEQIRIYQEQFKCRLIVVSDVILSDSIPYLEELLHDADPSEDMHMILDSPGGDGETAVRMVRSAQARCRELTVIVPDQAKSAATILAMGAHWILMGPTSDLGPVDPQLPIGSGNQRTLVSAKDIIAAVTAAELAVAKKPSTFPVHVSLLSGLSALQVQQARSALDRTGDLVAEALRSHPQRTEREVRNLKRKLQKPLLDLPKDHGAIFGATDAQKAGLPVNIADPDSDQWKMVWRLYAKYLALGRVRVYEGYRASQIIDIPAPI